MESMSTPATGQTVPWPPVAGWSRPPTTCSATAAATSGRPSRRLPSGWARPYDDLLHVPNQGRAPRGVPGRSHQRLRPLARAATRPGHHRNCCPGTSGGPSSTTAPQRRRPSPSSSPTASGSSSGWRRWSPPCTVPAATPKQAPWCGSASNDASSPTVTSSASSPANPAGYDPDCHRRRQPTSWSCSSVPSSTSRSGPARRVAGAHHVLRDLLRAQLLDH